MSHFRDVQGSVCLGGLIDFPWFSEPEMHYHAARDSRNFRHQSMDLTFEHGHIDLECFIQGPSPVFMCTDHPARCGSSSTHRYLQRNYPDWFHPASLARTVGV